MLASGVISRSKSEWASPVVLIPVVQCAWQAANTVRRSNRKKKNSNRNNHCRWHALRTVRHSLSL